MQLSDFNFNLPDELIGQKAIEPRDSCRLMFVNTANDSLTHHNFRDLLDLLDQNTVLILNDTKVFPARLIGTKSTGGKTELLLLKQLSHSSYSAIGKGKLKPGTIINFSSDLQAEVTSKQEDELVVEFNQSGPQLLGMLDELGKTPLPPYIHSQAKESDLRSQYQTVYAKEKGSAAAPTAGLHFTPDLLDRLQEKDVMIEKVTLHVGLGTFKPVSDKQVATKTLHSESFFLSTEVASRLNEAKKLGKKIIAVGTTTCRLLESLSDDSGTLHAGQGETNIFIQPGYRFKFVTGMITNFHLPSTSLLMLVSALILAPNTPQVFTRFSDSLLGKAYSEAIKEKYKFFSFGDAMLVI